MQLCLNQTNCNPKLTSFITDWVRDVTKNKEEDCCRLHLQVSLLPITHNPHEIHLRTHAKL